MEQPHKDNPAILETDPRFPSGAWIGFYHQMGMQARQYLALVFGAGKVDGEGRDPAGSFLVTGTYELNTGACRLAKTYHTHQVEYSGVSDGEGIAGRWVIRYGGFGNEVGRFKIWPDDLAAERERLRASKVVESGA